MKWRFFNLVVALSLVLSVATIATWARSYVIVDVVYHISALDRNDAQRLQTFASDPGVLRYRYQYITQKPRPQRGLWDPGWFHQHDPADVMKDLPRLPPSGREWWGFGFDRDVWGAANDRALTLQIIAPHWFVALLFGAIPAGRLVRLLRHHRRRTTGHCPICGYDLRSTPDRCPECGRGNRKRDIQNNSP